MRKIIIQSFKKRKNEKKENGKCWYNGERKKSESCSLGSHFFHLLSFSRLSDCPFILIFIWWIPPFFLCVCVRFSIFMFYDLSWGCCEVSEDVTSSFFPSLLSLPHFAIFPALITLENKTLTSLTKPSKFWHSLCRLQGAVELLPRRTLILSS